MNNKGKNGTNLGGNEAAVRWVFYPQHTVTCWQRKKLLLCKHSYPYLGDCHSLLLGWVTRHPPFKKQQTLNLRDGPQLDPNVRSPVWIMKGGSGPSTVQNQIFRGFLHCCLKLPCWCPFFLFPLFSLSAVWPCALPGISTMRLLVWIVSRGNY